MVKRTVILSDNGISKVWRDGKWVYKQQPKFMTDNEIWILKTLYPYGYVPYAEQVDIETIRMSYIQSEPVTLPDVVMWHAARILKILRDTGIRHGDLTKYAVLIQNNHPWVIDWAESRLACDPRPDKRREGDEYWLKRTMEVLCNVR